MLVSLLTEMLVTEYLRQSFELIINKLELRWLDTVLQGQYLPSLSINYVAINKVLEKTATTVVLDEDKNLL